MRLTQRRIRGIIAAMEDVPRFIRGISMAREGEVPGWSAVLIAAMEELYQIATQRNGLTKSQVRERCDGIESVCTMCDAGEKGLRQGADELEDEFIALGVMDLDIVVHPKNVGFSDINRDGMIGNANDAMDLISIILQAGCSLDEMRHSTMEEAASGSTTFQRVNEEMAKGNPQMAPVLPNSIRFGSIAGGHTYQGFRAFHAGLAHPDTRVTRNGMLSIDAAEQTCKIYGGAVRYGIKCKVIKATARVLFPRALQIISIARNMNKKAQAGEPDIQILRRMFNQAAATQARRGAPDWPMVRRFAIQSLPTLHGDIEEYIYFLSRRSGGTDGALFLYLARWNTERQMNICTHKQTNHKKNSKRQNQNRNRNINNVMQMAFTQCFENRWCGLSVKSRDVSVPGAAFAAAATLAEPLLSIAFLMYAYKSQAAAAPAKSGKSCSTKKVFGEGEIKMIGMSKDAAIVQVRGHAETLLSHVRKHVATNARGAKLMDQDNALAVAFGQLDVNVAECIATNKKATTSMLDGIVSAWAREFAGEFDKAYGAHSLAESLAAMGVAPQEAKVAKTEAQSCSRTDVVLEQFNGDFKSDDTLAALRKEGINVGVYIAPRGQKQPLLKDAMRVVRIKQGSVFLENCNKEVIEEGAKEVCNDYVVTDKAKLKEYNKKWPANDVAASKESASALLRAIVTVKVAGVSRCVRARHDMASSITLVKRGNVETLKGCAKGTIVLAAGAVRSVEGSKPNGGDSGHFHIRS